MRRKILIRTCDDCPHKGHKGGLGRIAYIPNCDKKGRELPYTIVDGNPLIGVTGKLYARQKRGIPDWCPLPKDK